MSYQCFLIEEIPRYRRWLRRYTPYNSQDTTICSIHTSYHTAHEYLEDIDVPLFDDGIQHQSGAPEPPHDDPRWPKACDCGHEFTDDDAWQIFEERLWKRSDTDEVGHVHSGFEGCFGPGAIYRSRWYEGDWGYTGPDGKCYSVILPNDAGYWVIDGPSYNNGVQGSGWTREGTPPTITVRPSILVPAKDGSEIYHGFLTNGVLHSTAEPFPS